jgi:hypothetical protein
MKKKGRRHGSKWPLIAVTTGALAIILLVITTPPSPSIDNSVIILDTLPTTPGGEDFTARCRAILEPAGYTIKAYTGANVTVERIRNLNTSPIIILRVHSSVFNDGVWFYTGESYSNTEHVLEQLTNELHIGRTSPTANYTFAVGSTYIRNNLKGRLNGTLVILMGCDGLNRSDLAEAFTDSGASVYVSWNGPVTVAQTDNATLKMMQSLVEEHASLDEALRVAMIDSVGFNSTLLYFPEGAVFRLKGD